MKKTIYIIIALFFVHLSFITKSFAAVSEASISVWSNEAIITAYTYDYKNIINRQKATAKYFTTQAWINYSQALSKSGLLQTVKTNRYNVSAVATMPPKIIRSNIIKGKQNWQIEMPILAVYKNPQFQQKQYLNIKLTIESSNPGSGTRGLAITSFIAKKTPAPKCPNTDKTKQLH